MFLPTNVPLDECSYSPMFRFLSISTKYPFDQCSVRQCAFDQCSATPSVCASTFADSLMSFYIRDSPNNLNSTEQIRFCLTFVILFDLFPMLLNTIAEICLFCFAGFHCLKMLFYISESASTYTVFICKQDCAQHATSFSELCLFLDVKTASRNCDIIDSWRNRWSHCQDNNCAFG